MGVFMKGMGVSESGVGHGTQSLTCFGVLETLLNTLYMLISLVSQSYGYNLCFTAKECEAQRG